MEKCQFLDAPVWKRHQPVGGINELAEQVDGALQLAGLHRLETQIEHFLHRLRLHLRKNQQYKYLQILISIQKYILTKP